MGEEKQKIIDRATKLLKEIQQASDNSENQRITHFIVNNLASRGTSLIHSVTGPKSGYAENLKAALKQKYPSQQFEAVAGVLQGFYLDLVEGNLVNIRHEVEAIVVSEILDQAKNLIKTKGVHPAASVIVACASVEEFLRNWCTEKSINIPEKQRSLSRFAKELRLADAIPLPMERRIQSWADYRNDAAHGDKWSDITPEIANRTIKEIEDFILEYKTILG